MSKTNKKIYVQTYGCQMNVYDSVRIFSMMQISGYYKTNDINEADMILINTCNIREKAADKLYSELGKINVICKKKKCVVKPIIAVAGCVSQAEGEQIFDRAPYVDLIVGSQSYVKLPAMVADVEKGKKHLIDLEFVDYAKFDSLQDENLSQGISSFISIQEGCDKFCHFCVVPYTRGAEFSRTIEDVTKEVAKMVASGTKEITLLGQNVSAYHGLDKNMNSCNIADLIKHIATINGLERIRYTTSHPIDMTKDLMKLHATEPKLMPFLHLPFQSGSDKILKLMNRKHNRQEYLDIITKFKENRSDMAFSTDIIVGYPEESCEDFADTLSLVEEVGFALSYSFKYSPRVGTPAALKKQLPEEEKNKRLQTLQSLTQKKQLQYNEEFIGKTVSVLIDSKGKYVNQLKGKSEYLQPVFIESQEDLMGKIIKVKIISSRMNVLEGVME